MSHSSVPGGRRMSATFEHFRNRHWRSRIDSLLSPPKSENESPPVLGGGVPSQADYGTLDRNQHWPSTEHHGSTLPEENAMMTDEFDFGQPERKQIRQSKYEGPGTWQVHGHNTSADTEKDTMDEDHDTGEEHLLHTPNANCPRHLEDDTVSRSNTMSTGGYSRRPTISTMTSCSDHSMDMDMGVPLERQGSCTYQMQVQTEPQTAEQRRLQSTFSRSLDEILAETEWDIYEESSMDEDMESLMDMDNILHEGQNDHIAPEEQPQRQEQMSSSKGKTPMEEVSLHRSLRSSNLQSVNQQPEFVMPNYSASNYRAPASSSSNIGPQMMASHFSSSSSSGTIWVSESHPSPPWHQSVWPVEPPFVPENTWPVHHYIGQPNTFIPQAQQHMHRYDLAHNHQNMTSQNPNNSNDISDLHDLIDTHIQQLNPPLRPSRPLPDLYSPSSSFSFGNMNDHNDIVDPGTVRRDSHTVLHPIPNQHPFDTQPPAQHPIPYSHTPPLHHPHPHRPPTLPLSSYTSLHSPDSISEFHKTVLQRLSKAISKRHISPSRLPFSERVRRLSTETKVAKGVRRMGRGVGDAWGRVGEGVVGSGGVGFAGWRDVSLEAERQGRTGSVSADLVYYGSAFM